MTFPFYNVLGFQLQGVMCLKKISLYCIYRFLTQRILSSSNGEPRFHSQNILKISASIFLKNIFLQKKKECGSHR